jgi:phosphoribosylanthranilate isomerase
MRVTAHGQQINNPFACTYRHGMLLTQLDLSKEQTDSVQEIFVDEKKVMSFHFASHSPEYQDMQQLQKEIRKFRKQSPEKLSAVLNQKQRQILRLEIIASCPLEFLQLSDEEKFSFVQDILQRENFLYDLGFNPVEMIALRQDVENHCQELKQSLSEILDEDQMEQLETLSSAMKPWNRGHARSVTFQENN